VIEPVHVTLFAFVGLELSVGAAPEGRSEPHERVAVSAVPVSLLPLCWTVPCVRARHVIGQTGSSTLCDPWAELQSEGRLGGWLPHTSQLSAWRFSTGQRHLLGD
jgi:hypothetical protein